MQTVACNRNFHYSDPVMCLTCRRVSCAGHGTHSFLLQFYVLANSVDWAIPADRSKLSL